MQEEQPVPFTQAVKELSRLPGIGEKTAERLVFHLLKQPEDQSHSLANALLNLPQEMGYCKICHNICSEEICSICANPKRTSQEICVVEMPQDLFKLEENCDFRGQYHVLGGRYSPLEGIFPEDLNLDSLERRVRQLDVKEIILALNPNTEGEATCELIISRLKNYDLRITRLATGLSHGTEIGWASRGALKDAFHFRRGAS